MILPYGSTVGLPDFVELGLVIITLYYSMRTFEALNLYLQEELWFLSSMYWQTLTLLGPGG